MEGVPNCSDYSRALPLRAAFYYAWYPETWTSAGHRYDPVLGEYSSSNAAVIDSHIEQMQYASVDAGIYSWWGRSTATDGRFALHLERARNKGFAWAAYYELDQDGARPAGAIRTDLAHLRDQYFADSGYLRVQGKPVVFVYAPSGTCASAAKWASLRDEFDLYVSMTDVPEWWTCNTLDAWHGYHPDERLYPVYLGSVVYSMSLSAGFWSAAEAVPRLARDFDTWRTYGNAMAQYKPQWQLVYFNEFGEGTNIEPSTARCQTEGCRDYLEALREMQ